MKRRLADETAWYPRDGEDAETQATETAMARGAGGPVRDEPPVTGTAGTTTAGVPTGGVHRRGPDPVSYAERTAEIPVVRGPGPLPRRPVELDDGTLWYPGVSRRLPAPFLLRLVVWLLLFVLLVGVGGLAVEHYHPTWLDFLRKTGSGGTSLAASSPGTTKTTGGGTAAPAGFRLQSVSSSGTNYAVPTSSYSIVITFPNDCWTEVSSPAGSSNYLVEQTLTPSESPKVIPVTGSATVNLGAAATSIAIRSGNRTLGVVTAPRAGTHYNFLPTR